MKLIDYIVVYVTIIALLLLLVANTVALYEWHVLINQHGELINEHGELINKHIALSNEHIALLKLFTYSERYITVQMLYERSSKRRENLVISQHFLEEGDDGFRAMISRENIEYVIQQFARQRSLRSARASVFIRREFLNLHPSELQFLNSQLPDDYYLYQITHTDVFEALFDMIKLKRQFFEKYMKNNCDHDDKCKN